jgi:hypothetical protein
MIPPFLHVETEFTPGNVGLTCEFAIPIQQTELPREL